MATAPSRMVAYLPSLRTFLHRLRATTSTPSSLTSILSAPLLTAPPPAPSLAESGGEEDTAVDFSRYSSTPRQWCICYEFPSLPRLPSGVLKQSDTIVKLGVQPGFVLPGAVGTLFATSTVAEEAVKEEEEEEERRRQAGTGRDDSAVECVVQECPPFLFGGLMQLFPGVTLSSDELTIITISERTNHDMTSWSHDMEEEREELMEHVRGRRG